MSTIGARLNVFIGLLLVLSALSLINAQYQARRLFIEMERAQTLSQQFEIEWTQLKLDQSTFGKHSRIEAVANKELGMVHVTPDRTQYLSAEVVK
ncbi:MAG: cell division protein FtsL [Candidatus Aquirickettsiella gammari]